MTKKLVIKLEVSGKRPASIAKKMGVGLLKLTIPLECIREKFEGTPSKNRTKAMQIAAVFRGVTSTALEGDEKDELVVKGEEGKGFDPVKLVKNLRDKVGGAQIKSFGPEEEKKKEKEEKKPQEYILPCHPHPPVLLELYDYPTPRCFC